MYKIGCKGNKDIEMTMADTKKREKNMTEQKRSSRCWLALMAFVQLYRDEISNKYMYGAVQGWFDTLPLSLFLGPLICLAASSTEQLPNLPLGNNSTIHSVHDDPITMTVGARQRLMVLREHIASLSTFWQWGSQVYQVCQHGKKSKLPGFVSSTR